MDFDKDNFEEDNELAPLEEEEAGDVDEVAGVEIDEIVVGDDTEDESEVPKRASSGPKRGSASTSSKASAGRGSSRSSGGKSPAKKASVGKSKSSAKKSAKKKSGSARGKVTKKSSKKASRGSKKKKR
jgi:hypothetical protein